MFLERNREIIEWNIFSHSRFMDDLRETYRQWGGHKVSFLIEVKYCLQYYFWCKCEYEVLIHEWPPHESGPERKVDVYSQVMMNWGAFSGYLWAHRKLLGEEK